MVVVTPHKGDTAVGSALALGCGFYPVGYAPEPKGDNKYGRTDWSRIEMPVLAKVDPNADPFDKIPPEGQAISDARQSNLGQMVSDTELLFHHQHRMFHFTLVFFGPYARLVYVDRSGTFVSEKIDYIRDESKLTEFLWRYSNLSPAQRGYDMTVERITEPHDLAQKMRNMLATARRTPSVDEYVLAFFQKTLDSNHPWWKLQVHDEITNEVKCFVAAKPHFQARGDGVRGRCTRGYIAVPLMENGELDETFVYLKDAWRVKHDAIEKEGDTLKLLNDNKVPYVPTLVCHGDLPGQVTRTPEIWKELRPCPLRIHQHYRIVVMEVGKPLSEFKVGYQLLKALYHCTLGMCSMFSPLDLH